MLVRALAPFVDESGRHSIGDVFQMEDGVAVVRIRAGLVKREPEEVRTATLPAPEMAVTRRGR